MHIYRHISQIYTYYTNIIKYIHRNQNASNLRMHSLSMFSEQTPASASTSHLAATARPPHGQLTCADNHLQHAAVQILKAEPWDPLGCHGGDSNV